MARLPLRVRVAENLLIDLKATAEAMDTTITKQVETAIRAHLGFEDAGEDGFADKWAELQQEVEDSEQRVLRQLETVADDVERLKELANQH